MIPTGYAQLSLAHTGDNFDGECINTFGIQNTVDMDAAGIGDAFKGALTATDLLTWYSSSVLLTEVRVKLGPDSTGESAVTDIGLTGDVGGQSVSPQVAMLVRRNTALGGRRGRGRFYIPGLPAATLDNSGTFDPANVEAIVEEWTALFAAMSFVGLNSVLLHDSPLTPTPITTLVGQSRVATQRRRARR